MSDGDGAGGIVLFLFAAGPATGFMIYAGIVAKYRNRSARYMPEKVVDYKVTDLRSEDAYVRRHQSGSRYISGRNDTAPHQRAKYVKAIKGE